MRLLTRALFPKCIVLSRSSIADLGYFYFNVFVFGIVLGWAVLSYDVVSRAVFDLLVAAFGPVEPTLLPLCVDLPVPLMNSGATRCRSQLISCVTNSTKLTLKLG